MKTRTIASNDFYNSPTQDNLLEYVRVLDFEESRGNIPPHHVEQLIFLAELFLLEEGKDSST